MRDEIKVRNEAIKKQQQELKSDELIRGMIENLDAYRKPDRSMAENLLIMDLQELREIIRKEKKEKK